MTIQMFWIFVFSFFSLSLSLYLYLSLPPGVCFFSVCVNDVWALPLECLCSLSSFEDSLVERSLCGSGLFVAWRPPGSIFFRNVYNLSIFILMVYTVILLYWPILSILYTQCLLHVFPNWKTDPSSVALPDVSSIVPPLKKVFRTGIEGLYRASHTLYRLFVILAM